MDSFKPAFSPAKYGWHDALALNCLQWVQEMDGEQASQVEMRSFLEGKLIIYNCSDRHIFTQPSGTENEADHLTLHFIRDYFTLHQRMSPGGGPLNHWMAGIFKPEEPHVVKRALASEMSDTLNKVFPTTIPEGLKRLRRSLYQTPRKVAFLSAKHKKLGAASGFHGLSDDLFKMILAFDH